MSTRDYAVSVLASLSEEKMAEFITLFADRNTIARMETEMIMNDPNPKLFDSVEEFIEDMEREDE